MEVYKKVIEIVDANLIYCLIPIILVLMFLELIFKNQFETKKVLNLICWTIIIYTIITINFYLIETAITHDEYAFENKAIKPNTLTRWIMLFGALVLPFTLLIKKVASKFWYILVIALGMKSGVYFERFVIITTSFYRDHQTKNTNAALLELVLSEIGLFFLQGTLIAILILGIFEALKRKKLSKIR